MMTQEQNDELTRVGPGTPMGDVLPRHQLGAQAAAAAGNKHYISGGGACAALASIAGNRTELLVHQHATELRTFLNRSP